MRVAEAVEHVFHSAAVEGKEGQLGVLVHDVARGYGRVQADPVHGGAVVACGTWLFSKKMYKSNKVACVDFIGLEKT